MRRPSPSPCLFLLLPLACTARSLGEASASEATGLVDGGGDFGTGQHPGAPEIDTTGQASDLPQDLDPLDCVGAIALGIHGSDYCIAVDEPGACLACATVGRCDSDSECAPGAVCDGSIELPGPGGCIRECASDASCTDDRECLELPGHFQDTVRICGVRSDDPFACAALREGDPCRARTDQESCEGLAYSGDLDVRCDWITESLVADASSCAVIATEGHCIATVPASEGTCDAKFGCRADGAEVSYRDYGGGTVGLVVVPASRQLAGLGGESDIVPIPPNCDFSATSAVPVVCNCAP